MSIRCLGVFLCATMGAALIGCGESPRPNADAKPSGEKAKADHDLTAEQAKSALTDLLRTTQFPYLAGDHLEQIARDPLNFSGGSTASWANFRFDLQARTYSYHVDRGSPGEKKPYRAEFGGAFELKDGAWIATRPRVRWET